MTDHADQAKRGHRPVTQDHGSFISAIDGKVPDEVSVVGFNDTEESAHDWPPLTFVRQLFAEMGRRSAQALTSEIQSREHHFEAVYIPTELVVRNSTGLAPAIRS